MATGNCRIDASSGCFSSKISLIGSMAVCVLEKTPFACLFALPNRESKRGQRGEDRPSQASSCLELSLSEDDLYPHPTSPLP
ncbi:hypothetical protein [Bacteroides sp.]|uniref:hypothetical protein n=1 Tax=Bacteroides sp. TaxID=29523 RepID=UPI002FCB76B3